MIVTLVNTAVIILFFFFNVTATPEIYTFPYTTLFRSQLEVKSPKTRGRQISTKDISSVTAEPTRGWEDRKSTRLNSSHTVISYAVFCLKKKITAKIKLQSHRAISFIHLAYTKRKLENR